MRSKSIILAISHSYCANFLKGQAKFLKQNGYKVYVVSAPGVEIEKLSEEEGFELIPVDFEREISFRQDWHCLKQLIKILKRNKPSIVNAGTPKAGLLLMIAALFAPKTKRIYTLRGLRSETLYGTKKKIVQFTEWLSCNLANKVIVISPSLLDYAIELKILNREKGIVIGKGSSNGVDIKKFFPSEEVDVEAGDFRKRIGLTSEDFVIGYAGRLTKDKGIVELYKGFKLLRKKYSNVKLVLVGPTEKDDPVPYNIIQEMKNDHSVFMPGKILNIVPVFRAFNVLVLFSYREGFGNVALEAAAMGRPVVVSNIPGCRDTVLNGKTGFWVEKGNSKMLSELLGRYIMDPELYEEHSAQGLRRAQEQFPSEVIWNGQLELYNSLICPKF